MADERKRSMGPLIAAKIACCGALLLAATGALSGFGALLLDDGGIWLVVAAAALGVGLFLSRRIVGGNEKPGKYPHRFETGRWR